VTRQCGRCGSVDRVQLVLVERADEPVPLVTVALGRHGIVTDPRVIPEELTDVPERYAAEPRCAACREPRP
jgi:hypothetical protein